MVPYKNEDGDKKFMASGSVDLAYTHVPISSFFGKFEGMITIPKLADKFPYDWVNAKFGLPYDIGGDGILIYKPQTKFILGNVNFGGRVGNVEYRIELAKRYDDPDFFTFRMLEGSVTRAPSAFTYRIDVPDDTRLAIVKATNLSVLPTVALMKPDGTIISVEEPSDDAELNTDASQHNAFWTLYQPIAGIWNVQADVESSVRVYYLGYDASFEINAIPTFDGIEVHWDSALFAEGDSIDFFADDDQTGYNGAYLVTVDATLGLATIPGTAVESYCTFALQALAYQGQSLFYDYATDYFEGVSGFNPPQDIEAVLDPQTLLLEVAWTPSTDPDITGYVIELIENGTSVVIGMPYGTESSFIYQLEAFTGQQLVIHAYSLEGEVSCPSAVIDLVLTDVEVTVQPEKHESLLVYPNPFRDNCTVRIMSKVNSQGVIRIYNTSGALIKTWPVEVLQEEANVFEFSSEGMSPGNYFVVFYGEGTMMTGKVMLME